MFFSKFVNDYEHDILILQDVITMHINLNLDKLIEIALKYREEVLINKNSLTEIKELTSNLSKQVLTSLSKQYINQLKQYYSDDGLVLFIYHVIYSGIFDYFQKKV